MAKTKAKAAAKKKPVSRRTPAPKAAPQAAPKAPAKSITFPALVHVLKGGDIIPVTVADQVHLSRLHDEHGEASVKVQQ